MENKFVSLENLQQYHEKLVGKMDDNNKTLMQTVNTYTDEAVAKKASVQICVWEEDD